MRDYKPSISPLYRPHNEKRIPGMTGTSAPQIHDDAPLRRDINTNVALEDERRRLARERS